MGTYPTIPEQLFSKSAFGIAREAVYRTPVTPQGFTPFSSCTLEFDPGLFSPPTMAGVRSTHIYNLSGEEKAMGAVGAPLYSVNGIPLVIAAVGADASAFNGVTGVPVIASAGTPGTAGSSTSFAAAGVTAVGLTGIAGTFAAGQIISIAGSTDAVGVPADIVRVSAFATPNVTCTATLYIHTGTITVTTVGAAEASGGVISASTVVVAAGLGALFTVGDVIEVDLNGTKTAECRKILSIATDTLTVDVAWTYTHAANAPVFRVSKLGLFLHTVPLGDPPSFTFEKNIANVESLQFAGARVGKMTLHTPMGNNAATIAADMAASAVAVLPTPTAVTLDPSPPFIFKEAALSIFGVGRFESSNSQTVLDNQLKETYTYSGFGLPSYVTATDLHVNGTFDAIWNSFDDATTGYWQKMKDGVEGDFNFTLTHPSDGSFIKYDLPKVRLSKASQSPTVANIATQALAYEARYAIENANPSTIVLTVGVPGVYLPY